MTALHARHPATTIALVRHGQVHNPEGIVYGRRPRFRLSALGRRQAAGAARALDGRPLALICSSPLLRARQTAQALLENRGGLRLQVSRLIHEVRTPFEGLPLTEARARGEDAYTGAGAGYEQPADIVARARRFLLRLHRHHPGGCVAAVTHGDVIAFLVIWAAGRSLDPRRRLDMRSLGIVDGYPAHGSITYFRVTDPESRPVWQYQRTPV
jgi:broad specificity phosphatase PhoE